MEKFKPSLFQCTKCDSIIKSSYPGQFVECECRDGFCDDNSPYYFRTGGTVNLVSLLIEQDFEKLYTEDE